MGAPRARARFRINGRDLLWGLFAMWLLISAPLAVLFEVGLPGGGSLLAGVAIGTFYWMPGAVAWFVVGWWIERRSVTVHLWARILWYVLVGIGVGGAYAVSVWPVSVGAVLALCAVCMVFSVVGKLVAEWRRRRRYTLRPAWADKFHH
ncbi:hypothetical protein [Phytoactinopolyspora limicola]|uniref:hypothetical protein n=1 Tax=Phytoactinopolyspora limicola TaxID=2715536 RepID=UPI00140BF0F6|nr:hypothetical protein [Phytoactinopolyspora limicola]